jgi:hypothetical protein
MTYGLSPQVASLTALSIIHTTRAALVSELGFDARHDSQLQPEVLNRAAASLIEMDRKKWPNELDDELYLKVLGGDETHRLAVISALTQAELEARILRDNSYEI